MLRSSGKLRSFNRPPVPRGPPPRRVFSRDELAQAPQWKMRRLPSPDRWEEGGNSSFALGLQELLGEALK
jgi:hypothetical protein